MGVVIHVTDQGRNLGGQNWCGPGNPEIAGDLLLLNHGIMLRPAGDWALQRAERARESSPSTSNDSWVMVSTGDNEVGDPVQQVNLRQASAEPTCTIPWRGSRYSISVEAVVIVGSVEAYPRQSLFVRGPEEETAQVVGEVEPGQPNPRVSIPISPALAANVRRVLEARPLRSGGFRPAGVILDPSGKPIQPAAETANSLLDRGRECEFQGDLDQAFDLYTKAIKANPRHPFPFLRRCIVRIQKRELDKAQQDFAEALRLDPKDHGFYYSSRGDAWASIDELDKALADYSEALRLDPSCQPAYAGRAAIWRRKAEPGKALGDYAAAIRLAEQLPQHHWNPPYSDRAAMLADLGEIDKAIEAYGEIIKANENDWDARICRGNLWWKENNLDKALQDFTEAVHYAPEWETPQNALAWFLATADDRRYRSGKRAVEHATRACALSNWHSSDSLDTLAAACAEAGEFELAAAWQAKTLEMMRQSKQKPSAADLKKTEKRLEIYRAGKPYREEVGTTRDQ